MKHRDTVFDVIGDRQHGPLEYTGQMPTLKTNGHIKNASTLELVTVEMAEKISSRLGKALTVNDGCHVALSKDEGPQAAEEAANEIRP